MKARKGSTHGYDTVDHSQFNPELGGEAGFARLSEALSQHDIGLIIDFVPNHVGVHFADNPWWLDVLEWGPTSPQAAAFDIDWDLLPHRARGGVLLPILGSSYGEALERGEIELRYDPEQGSLSAWYFEHRLPIAPERCGEVLRMVVKEADAAETEGRQARARACGALHRIAPSQSPRKRRASRPNSGRSPARPTSSRAASPPIAPARDRPAQTLALHHLLERQHYKLGHWRLASSDINYRRFFDVNGLAGLRVEDPGTFAATHRLVKQLIADGKLQGIRLDHIDGLRDPAQYCQRLRRLVRDAQGNTKPFYTVIEKILCEHERLPHFAGVQGTTGCEWMNVITHVLVDPKGLDALDETWRQISNRPPRLAPYVKDAKRRVLETLLTSEFTVLTRLLARIANGHYSTRDFSADSLRQALELYVLHFPVYRTYLTSGAPAAHDRKLIDDTIARARAEWFAADEGIFDFLRDALTMDLLKPGRHPHSAPRVRRFALKVQQFTGPVMAKSLEDTAFYQFHRLLALNEVGGDAASTGLALPAFHEAMQARAKEWPHGMTATATHDTKRGEDARARIAALSEIPGEWTSAVARWKVLNAPHLALRGNLRAPSATFEYMLYQTLLGAWPLEGPDEDFVERIQAYALKAARKGKEETSWLNPHETYESRHTGLRRRILDPARSREFLEALQTLARRVALLGALNSLSQLTLKATLPGVPDFYQGTEFRDLSLVDPDNRRPVDFAARHAALASPEAPDWRGPIKTWPDGRLKLAWTRHLLKLRHELADVFTHGDYQPLGVSGAHADHVVAFARRHAAALRRSL